MIFVDLYSMLFLKHMNFWRAFGAMCLRKFLDYIVFYEHFYER